MNLFSMKVTLKASYALLAAARASGWSRERCCANENDREALLARGVKIAAPAAVEIGDSVDPARIAPGVVIHAGCKVFGAATSIGPGCVLGREAPATVEDCQLGEKVELKGGYFSGAVFLDGAAMGSGAQVRPGTILEEGAEMAHTVGLKQTIFFPFVVGGSLIQFLRRADGRRQGPQGAQRNRLVVHPFQLHAARRQGDGVADRRRAARGDAGPRSILPGRPRGLGGAGEDRSTARCRRRGWCRARASCSRTSWWCR